MLDDLVAVVEKLKSRIKNHGPAIGRWETRTRVCLVDPLLTALGWDVSDPSLVTVERENAEGGRPDYAL